MSLPSFLKLDPEKMIYIISPRTQIIGFLKNNNNIMERMITEEKLYHQHLFRLEDDLNERLLNHMEEYGFSLSGIVRRSIQMFLEQETEVNNGVESTKKTITTRK
jgi:hypothetical protein